MQRADGHLDRHTGAGGGKAEALIAEALIDQEASSLFIVSTLGPACSQR